MEINTTVLNALSLESALAQAPSASETEEKCSSAKMVGTKPFWMEEKGDSRRLLEVP